MATSFFYKLFLSTIGRMPAQYDHEVDSWWGIVLTEMGFLDPFREENLSYFLGKSVCVLYLALFLSALSLYNAYINITKQRDEAREDSRKRAYERSDLHVKLRDTKDELDRANEKLQVVDSDMDEDRKEFCNTIQALNDQHLADQEKIRSLEQDVWNTESDRDGSRRQVFQVSREKEKLKKDLSEVSHQLDLARAEVQTFSVQMEPQQGQATPLMTRPEARPKQKHRRAQRPSPSPKTHRKVLRKVSKAANPSTSFLAGPKSPRNLIDDNLSKGILQAMLVERDQKIKELQEQGQTAIVQIDAGAEEILGEKVPEALDLGGSVMVKDQKISDPEPEEGVLTTPVQGPGNDLGPISDEHGECSRHLRTQLARKDEEIRNLRAEKATADKESAETIATLRTELGEKEKEVTDFKEAHGKLVAEPTHSADTVQRLDTLNNEIEASRRAHAQCDESSTSQNPTIGQLVTAKEELEETLRIKTGEIGNLQGQVTALRNDLGELQETHAKCGEHANTRGSEMEGLRNAHEVLQGKNVSLLQQLKTAEESYTNLVQEHQRVQARNEELLRGGRDLQSTSHREIQTLQGRIEALNQTVDNQHQSIQNSKNNCPQCQKLREALDEVLHDVEMSDDNATAKLRKEIAVEIREELRSQVTDDVRRQIRGEVEREIRDKFQNHYSEVLANNSKRIKEQDHLLLKKDTELEKAKNAPSVNHAACAKREANLESAVIKLRQDVNIAQRFAAATKNLKSELETIKADQRRNVNPLQSKLTRCQRELETMKVDRDKARDNSSTYSKILSDLRKEHKALENEHVVLRKKIYLEGGSVMDHECTEEPVIVRDEQRKEISNLRNEVARLLKELQEAHDNVQVQVMENHHALPDKDHEDEVREARAGKTKAVYTQPASASPTIRSGGGSNQSSVQGSNDEAKLPIDGGEKSDDEGEIMGITLTPKPARNFDRRPTHLPTHQPTTEPVVGFKRVHHECSDGEIDDEREGERKKVKITMIKDGMHRLEGSQDSFAVAQGDTAQADQDME